MEHQDRRRALSIRTQHLWQRALHQRVHSYPLWCAQQVVEHLNGTATMPPDALCQALAEQGFLLELSWGDELRYPAFMVAEGEIFEQMPTLLSLLNQRLDTEVDRYLWLTQYQPELDATPAELLASREGRLVLLGFVSAD
ncbi:hypothetical protein [Gallaecimonas sp. GXIMD1310]|uniref:hypothetical protein n=1 Tax=Gallaecimonas sp. GXIMD1310 TaxID=3131926 RepID=UPI00324DCD78